MKWYDGNIPAAIAESKRRQLIFLVYISGSDDLSKRMDETWDNNEVSHVCSENCVAVKLKANTEQCVQFSAIYPVVCVPSAYFIGVDGKPIDIIAGHHVPQDFLTKLQTVIQAHKTQVGSQSNTQPPSEPVTSHTASQEHSQGASAGTVSAGGQTMPELTKEEKIQSLEERQQKARERIAAKQEKKAEEAKEKEKNDELTRRQLGKDLQRLREEQEEQERKEMASSWKKEREEARMAREKVREQIARDRAERKAAFEKEKAEREEQRQAKLRVQAEAQAAEKAQTEAQKRESARIQFRLPDGSHITETFSSSETLSTAIDFLRSRVGETYGNFGLMQTYPRRDFTEADVTCSLLDLNLAPSAALIVLPHSRQKGRAVSNNDGGIMGLIMLILAPVIWLGNFLMSIFSADGSSSNTNSTQPSQSSSPSTSPINNTRQSSTKPGSNVRSRQEGNIRRFTNAMDDDDDMTTYNGNSTQQM